MAAVSGQSNDQSIPAVDGEFVGGNILARGGIGVRGTSRFGIGVQGNSVGFEGNVGVEGNGTHIGVQGSSENGFGALGQSQGNDGVRGQSTSSNHSGVAGFNDNDGYDVHGHANSSLAPGLAPGGFGDPNIKAGVWGANLGQGYGVKGTSQTVGIFGQGTPSQGAGSGTGVAGFGFGPQGTGVAASGDGTGVDATGGARGVKARAVHGVGVEAHADESGVGLFAHSPDPEGGIATLGVQNILSTNTGIVAYGQTNGIFALSLHGSAVGGLVLDGVGVGGRTQGTTASSIGVFGIASNPNSQALAGRFDGNVDVRGNLHKSGGGFRIDHPLEPTEKYLNHSFVESAERKNVYDGVAVLDDAGQAVVELPAWFQALNSDFRYQLTCIGGFAPVYIARKLSDNRFVIAGGHAGMEVSWQVTGIRSDPWARAHPLSVEENKQGLERGRYRHIDVHECRDERVESRAPAPTHQKSDGLSLHTAEQLGRLGKSEALPTVTA